MVTKADILAKASDLFFKYGERTVTIEKIAKELHTSKRTFYNNFTDKEDLLRLCVQSYFAKVREENEQLIASANNAIEALGKLNFQITKRATAANPSFFEDINNYYPNLLKEAYRENGHFAHNNVVYLADWGIQDGIFFEDMDIEVTTRTVLTLLELMKDTDKFPVGEFSKKRLTFGIMVPYLRGMCTQKGREILEAQKELFGITV